MVLTMRYKKKYAVLTRLVDCEDDWGIALLAESPLKDFSTIKEARSAMKKDYRRFCESYDAEWTCDGKDHCRRMVNKDEISIDVPIWDGENEKDSWIRVRWKIVAL